MTQEAKTIQQLTARANNLVIDDVADAASVPDIE